MARSARFLLGLAVLAVAGWCGYWFIGARIAENAVANWMAREADQGRRWTCAEQSVGGFPFAFEVNCKSVALDASEAARSFRLTSGAFRASAPAWRFNHVTADITGPAQAILSSGERLDAQWTNMRTAIVVRSGRLDSYDGTVANLKATLQNAAETQQLIAADALELRLAPTPASADPALDIAINGRKVVSPLFDRALGGSDAGDVTARATIARIDAIGAGPPIDNLERWRAMGGKATITQFRATRGRVALDVAGELSLDDSRRLAGRLEGSAAGLEQLLARGGGVIGGLINMRANANQPGKGLPFAVTMKDGRVMLGPVRVGAMAPLY